MDKDAMTKAMKASISDVLEQMFFLPIDIVDGGEPDNPAGPDDQTLVTAGVAFEGVLAGRFSLTIPSDLAVSITADFLGTLPEELALDQVRETVKEMINMLAGNALSIYDADSAINLRIPEILTGTKDTPNQSADGDTIGIDIETLDSRMRLELSLSGRPQTTRR